MARIRSVKPEYFTSLTIAGMSVPARLHFIGLWTHVDDDGRAIDDPRLIKAAVWPLDDNMTNAKVEKLQAELADHGRIIRYEGGGRRIFQVVGWTHQKIDRKRKSSLPPPRGFAEPSPNDQRSDDEASSPDLGILGADLGSGSWDLDPGSESPRNNGFSIDAELASLAGRFDAA